MMRKGSFAAPQNMELLRETRLLEIEKKLTDIIEYAKPAGILGEDLKKIIDELCGEETSGQVGSMPGQCHSHILCTA